MVQMVMVSRSFLILLLILSLNPGQTTAGRSRARAFIEVQCRTTLYEDLCIRTLSRYVNNLGSSPSNNRLALIALKSALVKAQSTLVYIMYVAKGLNQTTNANMTGAAQGLNQTRGDDDGYRLAVQECQGQVNDGVEQLTSCIKETQMIKENGQTNNFPWHASNIQTWMSTAVTDATVCINGLSEQDIGGKTKALIKAKVLNFKQVTSIALALFNKFAVTYRSSYVKIPKV